MEDIELLEAVDPHMSPEELKQLKMKHRQSEEKDMTKADMEYMKSMFELYQTQMNGESIDAFG